MEKILNQYGIVLSDKSTGNIYIHVKDNDLDINRVCNDIKAQINSGYDIKISDSEKRIITLYKVTKLSDMPEEFRDLISKGLEDGSIVLS